MDAPQEHAKSAKIPSNSKAKLWLEIKGKPILGEGRAQLLHEISGGASLNLAARKLGMSYRHAWGTIKEMERISGKKIVEMQRGGAGGGGTRLTEFGETILRQYDERSKALENLLKEDFWEAIGLKISARNRLEGIVKDVELDKIAAKVKIKIEKPCEITALITREAVEELNVKKGDRIKAIIKSTEIMLGKE